MICQFHQERLGVEVPAHRLGMCRECFQGRPIKPSELRNVDSRPLPQYADAQGNLVFARIRGAAAINEGEW